MSVVFRAVERSLSRSDKTIDNESCTIDQQRRTRIIKFETNHGFMLTIREKLYDFIKVADEKKIKAIYALLEGEIEETLEWWKDKEFTKELVKEYKDFEKGKIRGISRVMLKEKIGRLI
jgi:hypothetical protein